MTFYQSHHHLEVKVKELFEFVLSFSMQSLVEFFLF